MKGGDVDVASGTGFSSKDGAMTPVVQLTINPTGLKPTFVQMPPAEARAIGLDLIIAASQAVADTLLRAQARQRGEDQDRAVALLAQMTREHLPPLDSPTDESA